MKDSQKGFGAVALIFALVIVGMMAGGAYRVYVDSQTKSSERTISQQNSELNPEVTSEDGYTFTPSSIDSSGWVDFEPFQGFSFKFPDNWELISDSQFGKQLQSGSLDENGQFEGVYNSPHKTTFLEYLGTRRGDENLILKGAEIKMYMTIGDYSEEEQKDPCPPIYKNKEKSLVVTEKFVICVMKVTKYGYDFTVNSAKMNYRLSTVYNPDYADETKDSYNSTALELVKSYSLY